MDGVKHISTSLIPVAAFLSMGLMAIHSAHGRMEISPGLEMIYPEVPRVPDPSSTDMIQTSSPPKRSNQLKM